MSQASDRASSTVIIGTHNKSVGTSLILTILFGPLGMLYSTIIGGIVMMILCFLAAFTTLGLGLMILWPICIIWGAMAANRYNRKQGIALKRALDKS